MSVTPDASRWRSSANYDHVEDLTASNLAWEWLRRNDAYDQDFQALSRADADPPLLIETIRQRWGLRFPDRPAPRPTGRTRSLVAAGGYERRRSLVGTSPSSYGC
ncbi:DUF6499 domain-containing protein [Rhodopseudomonas sp. G2_2311]|uniref:transcriptional regulator domain-containing protein n=1 Tax=Rhodopseudomonas sp. G2_2311 TaxID=3114287 RepID=UPI0039C693EC